MSAGLKEEAFFEFEEFLIVLHWSGVISTSDYKVRRRFLFSLLPKDSPLWGLFSEPQEQKNRKEENEDIEGEKFEVLGTGKIFGHLEEEKIIHFYPIGTGADMWEFHPFDNDFFPSIPHGHLNGSPFPKLDPYLGFVYDSHHKQVDCIKRKTIITLWNNDDFREFARKAISYYLNEHKHYKGWRVQNPLKLPRRR